MDKKFRHQVIRLKARGLSCESCGEEAVISFVTGGPHGYLCVDCAHHLATCLSQTLYEMASELLPTEAALEDETRRADENFELYEMEAAQN